jgi:FMN-dependent NADH-azoreductase
MGDVVELKQWREKKKEKELHETNIKTDMRNSLDNDRVKRTYKIKEPTVEERAESIRKSIARVNALMAELKGRTSDGK